MLSYELSGVYTVAQLDTGREMLDLLVRILIQLFRRLFTGLSLLAKGLLCTLTFIFAVLVVLFCH